MCGAVYQAVCARSSWQIRLKVLIDLPILDICSVALLPPHKQLLSTPNLQLLQVPPQKDTVKAATTCFLP